MKTLRIGFALIGPAFLFPHWPHIIGIGCCCAIMGIVWLAVRLVKAL